MGLAHPDEMAQMRREARAEYLCSENGSFRNMKREFELVTPFLARPAALIADDVEGNAAFLEWVERYKPEYYAVLPEMGKKSLMGLGVFSGERLAETR